MTLSINLQKYLQSKPYDQGAMILARRDSILSFLTFSVEVMKANPSLKTEEAMDDFGKDITAYQNTNANLGGVCQCLAIKWLKYKMKERSQNLKGKNKVLPDFRIDKLRTDKILDKAVHRQTMAKKEQLYTVAFEAAMEQYKVTPKTGWERQTTLNDVAGRVISKKHCYYVAGIKAPKYDGKHAIAIYTSSGGMIGQSKHAYVFDPNYGEMAFPLKQFGTLFHELVYSCYETGENDVVFLAELNAN